MAANAEAKIVIRGETKQAQDEVEKLNKKLGGLNDSAQGSNKTVGLLSGFLTREAGQAMRGYGEAINAATRAFVEAGREQVRVDKALEAVLKSTGSAVGLTADEIRGMASALQQATNFGDETVQRGQNMLLTFTQIGRETFPRATETMLNMATAMRTDVQSSAIQLGKALNNPVEGITALTRVGVRFTDEQKAMIEAMVEAGDVAGAQRVILDELEVEFGGLARATADASTQMQNAFSDIQEDVGKLLIPAFDEAARALIPVLQKVQAWIAENPELAKTIALLVAGIGGFLTVGGSLLVLLGSVTAAATALGIALGPVSVIGLAIVGLTALVVTLRENWGWMWQAMKDNGAAAIDFIVEKLNALMGTIQRVIERINVFQQARDLKELATFQVKDYTIPKRAMGGPASGLTLVGERGPELVSLPGGSYVHSNQDSRRMLGGASVSIGQITVTNEADEDRLIAKLTRLIQLQSRQAA